MSIKVHTPSVPRRRPKRRLVDSASWHKVRAMAAKIAARDAAEDKGTVSPRELFENTLAALKANPVSAGSFFDEHTIRATLWGASRGLPPAAVADLAGISEGLLSKWKRKGAQGVEPYRCWSVAYRMLLTGRIMDVLPLAIEKDPWRFISTVGGEAWREPKEQAQAQQLPTYQHNTYNLMMLPEGERMEKLAAVKERVRNG